MSARKLRENLRLTQINDLNSSRLREAKEKLEEFYDEERVRGLIIRSRARWHELGEESTKYFLTLEKVKNRRCY